MPSLFLNKHFKIIIYISFACVCVFEALFIHSYIEKPSEFKVMVRLLYISNKHSGTPLHYPL